jgi:hypothetical protein
VKQFHYTGWPDFGVPDYPHPTLAFMKRLSRFKRTTEGPDIIHCSAGVGRTGTLVAIQSMVEMAREEEALDIFNFVLGMRQQRNYMVQTEVRGQGSNRGEGSRSRQRWNGFTGSGTHVSKVAYTISQKWRLKWRGTGDRRRN